MNTANLQMEGMLMAVAALCRLMREKELLKTGEIDEVLSAAQDALAADRLRPDEVSAANVEAVLFPLRFLREANRREGEGTTPAYTEIATAVGRTRRAGL